jgi:RNA polymerase sigma-70 factor (ECF subfamily)
MNQPLEALSDTELVARAKEGSAPAFEMIYERHASTVARILASFAGPDRDLLDDLIQDVFVRVVERLELYTPSHPFTHWLGTVALNVGRNHVRRQSKVVSVSPAELAETVGSSQPCGSSWSPTPRSSASWPSASSEPSDTESEVIAATTLVSLVSRLPVVLREVVSLRVGPEMTYREIGDLLGIPEGTARRRMHDAIRILRELSPATDQRSHDHG